MNGAIFIAGAVAVAIGGVAFVALGGNERADQRRQAIAKAPTNASARAAVVDRSTKKRQIQDSLADLERRAKSKRVDLQTRIEQAGLSIKKQQFLMIFAVLAVVLGALTYFKSHSLVLAGLIAIMTAVGAPHFLLVRMKLRRIKKFIGWFAGLARHYRSWRACGPAARRHVKNHRHGGVGASEVRVS